MKTTTMPPRSWFADRGRLRGLAIGFVVALLFAQFSLAAHACQGLRASTVGAGDAVAAAAAMPCPDHAAADAQAADEGGRSSSDDGIVCSEHCKAGQQNVQPAALDVPAVALAMRYVVPALPAACAMSPQLADAAPDDTAPAAPPHAILHCVRRT